MPAQFIRFLLSGVANTIVGFGLTLIAYYWLELTSNVSNAIGYLAGFFLSYFLHRFFTFRDINSSVRSMSVYAIVSGISFGANLAILNLLLWLEFQFITAQVCAMVTFTLSSFLLSRKFAFTSWQK